MKYFFIGFFFLLSILLLVKTLLLNFYPDFNVYYFATKDGLNHINPYTKVYFTGFSYPPTVLPFLALFTFLPFFVAEKIWTIVSLICLFASLFVLFKIVSKFSFIEKLFISSLVFFLFPVKFTLGMGQINLIVLLFLSLGVYFYTKKSNLAGIFFGVSLLLKLFPVLFLVYFLLNKKWKLLGVIFLTFLSGIGLTALIFGPQIFLQFQIHGLSDIFFSQKTDYYNQALSGFLGRLGLQTSVLNIFRTLVTAIILFVTFFVLWFKKPKLLGLSLLLAASLITNTFSWQHHFVWLIPGFIFVYEKMRQTKSWIYLFFLGLSYILVATNMPNPNKFPVLLQSHVLYGTIILWLLILSLLLKEKA